MKGWLTLIQLSEFLLADRATQIHHGFMGNALHRSFWILALLPILLGGCCTVATIDYATSDFRQDRIKRIEKATVTTQDKLVVLVEGGPANSLKDGHYTVTVSLPTKGRWVSIPPEGMQKGWQMPNPPSLPVTIAPPVMIGAYQAPWLNETKFLPIAGAERTLYLVNRPKPDGRTCLFYTSRNEKPHKIAIGSDERTVKTPERYPLLLFLPLTVALDIAASPVELGFHIAEDYEVHHATPLPERVLHPLDEGAEDE